MSHPAVGGRSDGRAHLHRGVIDQQRAGVFHAHVLACGDVAADLALEDFLLPAVDGQSHLGGWRRVSRHHFIHQMRRAEGKIARQADLDRHGQDVAQPGVFRMRHEPLREQEFARLPQRLLVPRRAGRTPRGTLRDHRQRDGFIRVELRGLLAEINQAGRADRPQCCGRKARG